MLDEEFPTTVEWLKILKHKQNDCSDYKLAKLLGLTQQGISNLMLGKSVMSDTTALKVAELTGFSQLLLILSVSKERIKRPDFDEELQALPKDFFKAGCYVMLGFGLSVFSHFPSVIFNTF